MFTLINANIYTVANGLIKKGAIVVKNGKIVQVGKNVKIPKDSKIIDLDGRYVTPGFIDAHCHVGIFNEGIGDMGSDGNDYSQPVTPQVKSADGIYPDDEAFQDAIQHGVTTLCIAPGSANVVGGQISVLKPKSNILEEMLITDYVGLKCAFGENPKRVYGERKMMPTTRMGVAAVLRKELHDARNYLQKKEFHMDEEPAEGKKKQPFETDFVKEVYIPILRKEKPLRAHAHRMDDIQTAVRIAKEFDVNIVIEHCTEGYKIADYLAKENIPMIIGPLNGFKSKAELRNMTLEAPAILEKAGVKFALMTDAPVERIGSLFDDVRLYIRKGLSECTGLKAITIYPAEILGLSDRLGTLESGKDADFNIFNGDPFDFRSKIVEVYIEGEKIFEI